MIKSLFEEDEKPDKKVDETSDKNGEKHIIVENTLESSEVISLNIDKTQQVKTAEISQIDDEIETIDEIKTAIENPSKLPIKTETSPTNTVKPFEIERPIGQPNFERTSESIINNEPINEENPESSRTLELEQKLREIEEELKKEKELEAERDRQKTVEEEKIIETPQTSTLDEVKTVVIPNQNDQIPFEDIHKTSEQEEQIQVISKDFEPVSKGEGIRNMGMAWSAAIALFGAVVIMLIIGWFVDLLLGTSPWGIVVGILFGAVIGFVQFFRITSNITNPKPNDFDKVSLRNNLEDVKEIKTDVEEVKSEVMVDENLPKEEHQSVEKAEDFTNENFAEEVSQEGIENIEKIEENPNEFLEIPADETKV